MLLLAVYLQSKTPCVEEEEEDEEPVSKYLYDINRRPKGKKKGKKKSEKKAPQAVRMYVSRCVCEREMSAGWRRRKKGPIEI